MKKKTDDTPVKKIDAEFSVEVIEDEKEKKRKRTTDNWKLVLILAFVLAFLDCLFIQSNDGLLFHISCAVAFIAAIVLGIRTGRDDGIDRPWGW